MSLKSILFSLGFALAPVASALAAPLELTGVNLAGGEFGSGQIPGTYGQHYIYPSNAEVDYFVDKGMNVFRVPFRWERLQRTLGGDLDAAEFNRLNNVVNYITSKGASVILDPHNSARYGLTVVGTGSVTDAHFADFWSRLATTYKANNKVIFGLVNEPHGMPSTQHWLTSANTAIAEIRDTGAGNLVLVPGNGYSGAHSWNSSWYGTPNGQVMGGVIDPANNFAYELHQYLDNDSSGTSTTISGNNVNVGANRLKVFTDWAKANNARGFLGEFAVANSTIGDGVNQIGDEAISAMFDHMDANADVWLGWAWWAAGPWWGNYMYTMEPTGLGTANVIDRASMNLVEPRLAGISAAVPEPTGAISLLIGITCISLSRRRSNARSVRDSNISSSHFPQAISSPQREDTVCVRLISHRVDSH